MSKKTQGSGGEKIRKVSDLAREVKLSPRAVIDMLKGMGYSVRSAQSTVTEEMVKEVKEKLQTLKQEERKSLERRKQIWGGPEEPRKKEESRRQDTSRKSGKSERKPARARTKPRKKETVAPVEQEKKLILPGPVTVGELARMMGIPPAQVVMKTMELGVPATINQTLDEDLISLLAESFGYRVETAGPQGAPEPTETRRSSPQTGEPRPPVVTVMGHVDHGKTTLLDYLRKTQVVKQEAGGITQHIGAYQVEHQGQKITFIDTPGHEAFTAMRARGAQVTDLVVLVVAANEGVKPQTVEAINHARAAGVPILVAINKMDLDDANPDRVRRELSEHGLIPEDWGGDTMMVEISARTGQNVELLLDGILLKAEELNLKAEVNRPARGVVLEARLDRGKGPVATVLIQEGTLHVRDNFVCGTTYGRVRGMYDDQGRSVKEATPSQPVLVQGFEELPHTGDRLEVVATDREARDIAEKRKELLREQLMHGESALRVHRIQELIQKGELKEIPFILKADALGSVEAIADAMSKIEIRDIRPILIHRDVGQVTEADVELADASHAHIIAFHTRPNAKARRLAEQKGIQIKMFRVIYELLKYVEDTIRSYVEPEYREVALGMVEVRKVFKIPRVGTVAGCYVREGVVRMGALVRVLRDGEIVHTGEIASLKRFQEDVNEVKAGLECGIRLKKFDRIKEGDLFEVFLREEITP